MRATASSMWRLRSCQYWAREDVTWAEDPGTPERELGTWVHQLIANAFGHHIEIDPRAEETNAAALAEIAVNWFAEALRVDDIVSAEEGWKLSQGVTSRVVGRDYGDLSGDAVAGTTDLIWQDLAGTWHILDWKTGRRENAQPAVINDQLRTLAVLLCKAAEYCGDVVVHLAWITEDGVELDTHTLDAFDLADHEAQLQEWQATIPQSQPVAGKQCQYCPARASCPATHEAIATIADTIPAPRRLPLVTDASQFTGPEHAASQYALVRAAEAMVVVMKAALVEYADQHSGIPLPGNKIYKRTEKRVERIDLEARGSTDVLAKVLGDRWMDAVTVKTSKAALHDACRPLAATRGTTIKAIEADLMSQLRNVGAVRMTTQRGFAETKRTEEALGIPDMP
jgi:hypothetical protein